ncbi:hypothetical protein KST84_13375 [Fusobacterium nucleatum]
MKLSTLVVSSSHLLEYHKKIVFSLIKFGAYKEDRRSCCSINLEEIL